METRPNTLGNNLCNVHAAGNARLQLGDQYFAGGLVINVTTNQSHDYLDSHLSRSQEFSSAPPSYSSALHPTQPVASSAYGALEDSLWSFLNSKGAKNSSQVPEVVQDTTHDSQPPLLHLPLSRKMNFTGRTDELADLEARFAGSNGTRSTSLLGLGGVGKSSLALEFAYRMQESMSDLSILWAQASDMLNFENDYSEIGRQLRLSHGEADMKLLVKQHLSQPRFGRWLMILDNADDFGVFFGGNSTVRSQALIDFIPRSPLGYVIVTTRDRKVAIEFSNSHVINLSCLDGNDAHNLLESLLVDQPLNLGRSSIQPLLERLDFLPLAIVQAAAYINLNDIAVTDYMGILDSSEDSALELIDDVFSAGETIIRNKKSIVSAWFLAFEDVANRNARAREYLSLIACFDAKHIPQRLLPQIGTKKQIIEAMGLLTRYCLLTRRASDVASDTSYDMHRLVHLACRSWLRKSSRLIEWKHAALERILQSFPDIDHANRLAWSSYLPHVSQLMQADDLNKQDAYFDLMHNMGKCLLLEGKYREAIEKLTLVVTHREKSSKPSDHKILEAYSDLANALEWDDHCDEAEKYNQKALFGYLRTLNPDDAQVLQIRANIASVKRRRHQWTDAEKLDLQVMNARTKVLGNDHPDTFSSMASLGSTYRNMGLYDEAEKLEQCVMDGRRKILGEDHPDFLTAQASIASTYRRQRRLQEAEALELKVMKERKRILGLHHPDTIISMANLGSTYRRQERWRDVELIELEVIKLRASILGQDHINTITALGNLACTYRTQGKCAEAETLGRGILEATKRTLGIDHVKTLDAMSSLASTYRKLKRHTEADKLYMQVMRTRQRVLGTSHYETIFAMEEVARIFKRRGQFKEAISVAEQVFNFRERTLGLDHERTQSIEGFLKSVSRLQEPRGRRKRWKQQPRKRSRS